MNKYARNLVLLIFFCALGHPFIGYAVSYPPIPAQQEEKQAKGIKRQGDIVSLFQSGTADVKKEIHINDILIVYRETENQQFTPVGKIKVLSFVGTDYLKAEVVEGEIMVGDIGKKGDAASLVISSENQCK